MPLIAVLLAVIMGISELAVNKGRIKKEKEQLNYAIVCWGITIGIIMLATMLATASGLLCRIKYLKNPKVHYWKQHRHYSGWR